MAAKELDTTGVMNRMGYRAEYGNLLEEIAREADAIALRYFRAVELRVERKKDGTAVTQADREVEEMARARVRKVGWTWRFWEKRWAGTQRPLDRERGRE